MNHLWLAGGGVAAGLIVAAVVVSRLRSSGARQSKRAHKKAQSRPAPVELGETYELAIKEFTDHHSGERIAVGKVEGFVIFTESVPKTVKTGDVIRVRVLSFNKGKTSADAEYVTKV